MSPSPTTSIDIVAVTNYQYIDIVAVTNYQYIDIVAVTNYQYIDIVAATNYQYIDIVDVDNTSRSILVVGDGDTSRSILSPSLPVDRY